MRYNPKRTDPEPEQSSVRGKKKMAYNPKRIESKWQEKWLEDKIYEPDLERAKNKFYNLMMFPYPSAEGLHVGNVYAFVGADIYGRKKRMDGYDVFEPIGLDGFGIHSENYALKIGKHPKELAKISEKNFYNQLKMIGNGFAWDEKLETYDPDYYKWTQWIFIQMFKKGLAYRKKAGVNWCPSCKTVLADEQVISGECERCSSHVEQKELEQWFFRITDYAERLLKDLERIDWSERVKIAQRNWIGKSEGSLIKFEIRNPKSETNSKSQIQNSKQLIEVFTTRPDTLFGATYLVLSPEYPWLTQEIRNPKSEIRNKSEIQNYINKAKNKTKEERQMAKSKTGVELKGIKAINPANNEEIPIFVADYVLSDVGTGAIMAVPAHDQRDFEFAKKFKLPIKEVVRTQGVRKEADAERPQEVRKAYERAYEDEGILINSGKFDGMESEKAKWEITKFVKGKKQTQYRLRDWLISRQRYWGPPIPIIYCRKCWEIRNPKFEIRKGIDYTIIAGKEYMIYAVPEKDLPVVLPDVEDFKPTGTDKSPLATVEKFVKTKCPKCKGEAQRETDVSDTFLDSAWYFFRYIDTKNKKEPFDKLRARKWLPVDMYIGGAEHSVLHLLYTRFLTKTFYDWGLIKFEEPFDKFRAHGLLIKDGAKMSKSKSNVVNPDEYIKAYGADVLRMYLMFLGPFEQGGDFRDEGIIGISRFLERTWKLGQRLISENPKSEIRNPKQIPKSKFQIQKTLHQTIKKVTEDIEGLQYNTAISQLMILLNKMDEEKKLPKNLCLNFLQLLAPFAPHITEELWHALGQKGTIHKSDWPKYDKEKIKEDTFELVVQINGKVRDKINISVDISVDEMKKIALELPRIKELLGDKRPKKMIAVKGRLVNIVLD